MQQADILVVGAGLAGASIAAELSETHSVIVLEQEEVAGYHATGRSAALFSQLYGNDTVRALTRASAAFFRTGASESFVTARGCLHIASFPQIGLLESFFALPDIAQNARWLDAHEALQMVPILRRDYIAGAVFEPEAYDIDVNAVHQHFLRRLKDNGGALHRRSELLTAQWFGDRWHVEIAGEEISAGIIVNAAGAWGDIVAARCGAASIGLEPKRRTAVLVDSPTGHDIASWPVVLDIGEQFYFKPDAGKLLLSPADETPSPACDAAAEELDIATAVDRVQSVAALPVSRISHSWAGLRTFVADRSPVVGFDVAQPGFFWLVGQGGYGIQIAPALARAAASLVLGHALPPDVEAKGVTAQSLSPARLETHG